MRPDVRIENGSAVARDTVDATIVRLASDQHGVVARWQLLEYGLSPDSVDRRLKGAWLQSVHRGVYAVGPVRSPLVGEMAAVLACGDGSALSHWSATELWELVPRDSRTVEVSVTRGNRGRMLGIRVHRAYSLRPDEVTKKDGVPVTTVVRTLHDLAGVASVDDVERAVADALARRLVDHQSLLSARHRYAGRRGTTRLHSVLASVACGSRTRSEAEARFVRLVRRARLPSPLANVRVAGYEVDFFWQSERLVVEVDGHAFHASPTSFESDRRRDAALVATGLRVIRVTWRQITREPEVVLVRLTQALGDRT